MMLCMRVKNPEIDDYKKLTRVMQYIRNMTKLTLTIEPSDNPKYCFLYVLSGAFA